MFDEEEESLLEDESPEDTLLKGDTVEEALIGEIVVVVLSLLGEMVVVILLTDTPGDEVSGASRETMELGLSSLVMCFSCSS